MESYKEALNEFANKQLELIKNGANIVEVINITPKGNNDD